MKRDKLPALPSGAADALTNARAPEGKGPTELRYRVKLITPMFGGGVRAREVDTLQPFRTKGIKGHLRWWWRVMARAGDLDSFYPGEDPKTWDVNRLREKEGDLWGMLAADGPKRSAVSLQVLDVHALRLVDFEEQESNGNLDYVYFSAKKGAGNDGNQQRPEFTKLLCSGANFELRVSMASDVNNCAAIVQEVIETWATFGGIGSRTRRGAGAIEVRRGATLLCALDKEMNFVRLSAPPDRSCDDGELALAKIVMALKKFRQGRDFARGKGTKVPGRSHWPEPDAIRGLIDAEQEPRNQEGSYFHSIGPNQKSHRPDHKAGTLFPRAAFGMPLEIKFLPKFIAAAVEDERWKEPASRRILPLEPKSDRMASPLIIRPVAALDESGRCRYYPTAAVLLHHPAHQLASVRIDPPAGGVAGAQAWDISWQPGKGAASCLGIQPLEGSACAWPDAPFPNPTNAVQSFLNWWAY
jgi:CRISPR-associated protein Cmr1